MRKFLVSIILIAGLLIAAAGLPLRIMKKVTGHSYPMTCSYIDPDVSPLQFTTTDSLVIQGFLVMPDSVPTRLIVATHGIADSTSLRYLGHARHWARNGFATLMVDLRAHGGSQGSQLGLAFTEWRDLAAAVDFARHDSLLAPLPVTLLGISMGGATVLNAAPRIGDIDRVVALSPFSSIGDIAREHTPFNYMPDIAPTINALYGEAVSDATPKLSIGEISCPILIIRAAGDRIVPPSCTDTLSRHARTHLQVVTLDTDNHLLIDDYAHPECDTVYWQALESFLAPEE